MRFYYCLHIHVIPIERKMIKLILVKHLYVGSLRNVVGSRIRERSGAMAGASCYRRRESLLECCAVVPWARYFTVRRPSSLSYTNNYSGVGSCQRRRDIRLTGLPGSKLVIALNNP